MEKTEKKTVQVAKTFFGIDMNEVHWVVGVHTFACEPYYKVAGVPGYYPHDAFKDFDLDCDPWGKPYDRVAYNRDQGLYLKHIELRQ